MSTITVQELHKLLHDKDTDEIVVDVREPVEHKGACIPGSKCIPLNTLESTAEELGKYGTVYVFCQTGGRSSRACDILRAKGVNVVNVDGGITAWRQAGLPVVGAGTHRLPIIRQVLLSAGLLILTGAAVGLFITPWGYALSAAVGCGLTFAGATGICGMDWLLRKMPWNKVE